MRQQVGAVARASALRGAYVGASVFLMTAALKPGLQTQWAAVSTVRQPMNVPLQKVPGTETAATLGQSDVGTPLTICASERDSCAATRGVAPARASNANTSPVPADLIRAAERFIRIEVMSESPRADPLGCQVPTVGLRLSTSG